MKRRAKRDLGVLVGAVAILAGVVFFNGQVNRKALAAEMDKIRRAAEKQRREEGFEVVSWDLMRKTKGSLKKGGTFAEELHPLHGQNVNMMGFMVPNEQFRDVTEFWFLPLPIECYFCLIPPEKDVMLVQMEEGKTVQIYDEVVMVNGTFNLHEGPGVKFFYSLTDALVAAGEPGAELNRKYISPEHMAPQHAPKEGDMLPPVDRSSPKD